MNVQEVKTLVQNIRANMALIEKETREGLGAEAFELVQTLLALAQKLDKLPRMQFVAKCVGLVGMPAIVGELFADKCGCPDYTEEEYIVMAATSQTRDLIEQCGATMH